MDTEQENTDLTGADVYNEATSTPEPVEAEVREDRARDEKGRFAPREEAPEVEAVAEAPAPVEAPKETKPDHRIPLTELLNEREKRQAEARRAENLQRELEALRQQIQPPKVEPVPDQFANPDAYNEYWRQQNAQIQQTMDQRFRDQEANFSLRIAHMQHGEKFEQAYQALMDRAESGDRSAAQMVANSPNPGQTLMDWHQREQVIAHVGTDPEAYRGKLEAELLANPEFLAKAVEAARGVASTQPTQVKLPPSLNKAVGSHVDDSKPMDGASMYHHAIGRG